MMDDITIQELLNTDIDSISEKGNTTAKKKRVSIIAVSCATVFAITCLCIGIPYIRDSNLYSDAMEYEKEEKYVEALRAFSSLQDFKDSSAKTREITDILKKRAEKCIDSEQFEEATALYTELSEFGDYSSELIMIEELSDKLVIYNQAISDKENGVYDRALESFHELYAGNYKDAEQQVEEIASILVEKAKEELNNGNIDEAEKIASTLSDYSETEALAEEVQNLIEAKKDPQKYIPSKAELLGTWHRVSPVSADYDMYFDFGEGDYFAFRYEKSGGIFSSSYSKGTFSLNGRYIISQYTEHRGVDRTTGQWVDSSKYSPRGHTLTIQAFYGTSMVVDGCTFNKVG